MYTFNPSRKRLKEYTVPRIMQSEFTPEEIHAFKRTFAFMDHKRRGVVGHDELKWLLKKANFNCEDDEVAAVLSEALGGPKVSKRNLFKKKGRMSAISRGIQTAVTSKVDFDSEEAKRQNALAAEAGDNVKVFSTQAVSFADFLIIMHQAIFQNRSSSFADIADHTAALVSREAGQSIFYLFLVGTFLCLVSTSQSLFEFFQCKEFPEADGGTESFLQRDMSVDCNGDRYKKFAVYAGLMVLVYPVGIPLMYFT